MKIPVPKEAVTQIMKDYNCSEGRVHEDGSVEIKGFAAEEKKNGNAKLLSYYKKAESDDFIKFGLLPELIGRSPIKAFVNLLSKNENQKVKNAVKN